MTTLYKSLSICRHVLKYLDFFKRENSGKELKKGESETGYESVKVQRARGASNQ